MNMLRFLVLATIVLLGAQSVLAAGPVDVTHYSLGIAGIGRIDYGMTYQGTVSGLTPGAIVQKHTLSNDAISAQVTGISFKGADQIKNYCFAASEGGDVADVYGIIGSGAGATASVSNFQMFGYVTPNYAYAGQYADQMKGNSFDLEANSYNKNAAALPILDQVGAGGYYTDTTGPTQYEADVPTQGLTAPDTGTEHTLASSSIYSLDADADSINTLTKVYQWAQAGGSDTPADFQNGMWSQAIIGKGSQISMKTGDSDDRLKVNNYAEYYDGSGAYMISDPKTPAAPASDGMINLASSNGGTVSATTNSDNMGYADKTILYANTDTKLAVTGLIGNFGSNSYESGSYQAGVTTILPTSSSVSNTDQFTGSKNLFLWSLVNSANPNGVSRAVFY